MGEKLQYPYPCMDANKVCFLLNVTRATLCQMRKTQPNFLKRTERYGYNKLLFYSEDVLEYIKSKLKNKTKIKIFEDRLKKLSEQNEKYQNALKNFHEEEGLLSLELESFDNQISKMME